MAALEVKRGIRALLPSGKSLAIFAVRVYQQQFTASASVIRNKSLPCGPQRRIDADYAPLNLKGTSREQRRLLPRAKGKARSKPLSQRAVNDFE